MIKKKALMLSAIASLLAVGAGVGTVAFTNSYVNLAAEATNNLTMTWEEGQTYMVGQDKANHIAVSYVDGVFQNTDPIQRIKEVQCYGSGGLRFQAGYYKDGYGSEVLFTDPKYIDITENITFPAGQEPSFIKLYDWILPQGNTCAEITYDCVNGAKDAVNGYPLNAGYYLTGDENISARGETWTPLSALPFATANNEMFVKTLPAGTRFKVTWYDGFAFNWSQPERIDAGYNDAINKKLIYQEGNGDYFVAKTGEYYISLQGKDINKTMKIVSYDDAKDPETTILRLVGDDIGWDYSGVGRRLYQDPTDPNIYRIDKIQLNADKHYEVKYGNADSEKFGYQQITETGYYSVEVNYTGRTLKLTKLN